MEIDRQVFVGPTPPPRSAPSLLGPALFLLVVAAAGAAGYVFVQRGGMHSLQGDDPQLAQVAQKLEEIEKRLAQLEKRRAQSPPEATAAASAPPSDFKPSQPGPIIIREATAQSSARRISPPDGSSTEERPRAEVPQELASIRSDVASNREAWQATTDRLSLAVGELSTQQAEIARTNEAVTQFINNFERTPHPFRLHKRTGRVRAGPVWLRLRETNWKKQLYTAGLFLDDRWVEVKDRALNEPVEFYVSQSPLPLELVVTEIRSDLIAGQLLVPKNLKQREISGTH